MSNNEKLDELKKEAAELGIAFSANIGEATLQQRIDDYHASQADDEDDEPVVKTPEVVKENKPVARKSFKQRAKAKEKEARKTRVVTIIDNDNRENNHTTVVVVDCSCAYFDLGKAIIPLNTPVEVRQGHINVLNSIKIPQHVRSPEDPSLSRVVLRNRYSVQYEDRK